MPDILRLLGSKPSLSGYANNGRFYLFASPDAELVLALAEDINHRFAASNYATLIGVPATQDRRVVTKISGFRLRDSHLPAIHYFVLDGREFLPEDIAAAFVQDNDPQNTFDRMFATFNRHLDRLGQEFAFLRFPSGEKPRNHAEATWSLRSRALQHILHSLDLPVAVLPNAEQEAKCGSHSALFATLFDIRWNPAAYIEASKAGRIVDMPAIALNSRQPDGNHRG